MNKVWKILQVKGDRVFTVRPEATVSEALRLMADKGIGSVLVTDGDRLVGIFTERDYARRMGLPERLPSVVPVGDVMTADPVTVHPGQSVNECMAIMTEKRVRHLPVLEDGRLIGLVSIGDVVKDMIEELQFLVRQMEGYISGLR